MCRTARKNVPSIFIIFLFLINKFKLKIIAFAKSAPAHNNSNKYGTKFDGNKLYTDCLLFTTNNRHNYKEANK